MQIKPIEERYETYLDTLPLGTLRSVARKHGVPVGVSKKDDLISKIIGVLTGKMKPVPPSKRGAPVKETFLDPSIAKTLTQIRREFDADNLEFGGLGVAAGDLPAFTEPIFSGILEVMQGGYGFLRAKNCQPTSGGDVFVSAPAIHSNKLREGDLVVCTAKCRQKNESPALESILSVNGLPVGEFEQRPNFDALTAQYPNEKIKLGKQGAPLSLRVLDLFAPIGKGQRALVIAPPKAGKTTLLKEIARSIAENKDLTLIVLLIDERPEEVTDFRLSVEGAQVVYSTFDEGAEHHVRAAELTMSHAKRMAETGHDVVILLDSLTKLTRAYNYLSENSGKTLSGGLEAGSLTEPKRFFGAARNTVEAGSITVIATALVETGSRMDDVIYEEFKGTGNADVFLSRDLAERRVFPAIDVRRSGTRKEELLFGKEELAAVYKLRERGITENVAGLLDMLKKTKDNEEFIARLSDWIRVYKNA